MSAKLDKMEADWKRACRKRDTWTAKADEMEARFKEQENLEICEVTHSYNLRPEQLARVLEMLQKNMPETESIGSLGNFQDQPELTDEDSVSDPKNTDTDDYDKNEEDPAYDE